MARLPAVRVSYSDDAQYLLRLSHAIELDKRRPLDWRKMMIARLEQMAGDFLSAPKGE